MEAMASYWRRRNYQRLEGPPLAKKTTVRLNGRSRKSRSRRTWKLRAVNKILRLRVRIPLPRKLFARLKNVYPDGIWARYWRRGGTPSRRMVSGTVWRKAKPNGGEAGAKTGVLDMRMVLFIYNNIMAASRQQTL